MSEWLEVRLESDQPTLDGLLTFDGEVVEVFGFNDVHSVRLPARLIEGASVSFKKGMLSQPSITFPGRNGCMGYNQAIDPSDEIKPALEDFAATVNRAASRHGGNIS
jgi:hypothetical protein